VAFCPRCKIEWEDKMTECPICSAELTTDGGEARPGDWVVLGSIEDKLSADYARAVLTSYEIPAVVVSRSGFFGQIGLTLNTFYKPGALLFEVSVPEEYCEEAAGVLDMALGEKWQRKDV